nr:hypothetical protein [uncultured Roseococcus sp.]
MTHAGRCERGQRLPGRFAIPFTHIRNEEDLMQALIEVAEILQKEPEPGTPEEAAFDALWELITEYEENYGPEATKSTD